MRPGERTVGSACQSSITFRCAVSGPLFPLREEEKDVEEKRAKP